MLQNMINYLIHLSNTVSVETYSLVGSFIEEIIAPIPSPLVMGSVGSIAFSQGKEAWYLIVLAAIGAIAKTVASLVFYYLADFSEDVITSKFGKVLGLSGFKAESIGKFFENSKKDDLLVIILRALPIVPGAPVSVFCGLLKMKIRDFLYATFIGTMIRNLIFAGIGYAGVSKYQVVLDKIESSSTIVEILIVGGGVIALGYLIYLKKNGKLESFLHKILKF